MLVTSFSTPSSSLINIVSHRYPEITDPIGFTYQGPLSPGQFVCFISEDAVEQKNRLEQLDDVETYPDVYVSVASTSLHQSSS